MHILRYMGSKFSRKFAVTGSFLAQRISYAEMFPFDDVIMFCKWLD